MKSKQLKTKGDAAVARLVLLTDQCVGAGSNDW